MSAVIGQLVEERKCYLKSLVRYDIKGVAACNNEALEYLALFQRVCVV